MNYLSERARKIIETAHNSFCFDLIMGLTNSVDCGDQVPAFGLQGLWFNKELSTLSKENKLTLISELALQAITRL